MTHRKHSTRRSRVRRGTLSLALVAAVSALLALASMAQAVTFTKNASSPVTTGGQPVAIAVNQSSHDFYVSSMASANFSPTVGEQGSFKQFNSALAEQTCTLSPVPDRPASMAIDQANGNLYLFNATGAGLGSELRAYPQGCGNELPATTGTADTHGTTELSNVSVSHPLLVGEGVQGNGIPTATGTATTTVSQATIAVESSTGKFALGQRITGAAMGANTTIVACIPNCTAPTELELSGTANQTSSGVAFTARTVVTSVVGSTVELSNAAEATEVGTAISGFAWQISYLPSLPIAAPSIGAEGDLYYPNKSGAATANKLQKFTLWGSELVEGSFPVTTAMRRPAAAALDAKGDVFVPTSGESSTFSCTNTAAAKLKKLKPDGSNFSAGEAGVTGAESEFAGLTENATAVAVDQRTGNVFVGKNCHETFKVEIYGPGGAKLGEFGSGEFGSGGSSSVGNVIAVDEASGTIYATDPGNGGVQVFNDTSTQETLSTSVSGDEPGEVQCNGTGKACLEGAETYDEGQEVIVEAVGGTGFEEWAGGTGSAEVCNGVTTTSCTFTLNADSSIEAVFASVPTVTQPLEVTVTGEGEVTSPPPGIACTEASSPCVEEFGEGSTVTLTADPEGGWEFTGWGGACSGTGSCEVEMTGPKSVTASFAMIPPPPNWSLTIEVEGEGSVSATEPPDPASGHIAGCEEAAGECTAEYVEGTEVPLTATPAGGSHFVEWETVEGQAGTCASGASCEAGPLTATTKLVAKFAVTTTSPLTVFVTGHGTVTSNPPGINCTEAGGTCTEPFEGTVTLTGAPETGWVMAGWIGCRHTGTGTCEVAVNEAKEVTAVFLEAGANGKGVVIGTATAAECPEGGITVEVEGSGTKQAICNGEMGTPGTPGSPGAPGAAGPQGPAGEGGATGPGGPAGEAGARGAKGVPGARGAEGPAGPQGPAGKQGARGPKGKQGPAGKVKVICKVKQKKHGKKVKVTCTVKYPKGSSQARRIRWSLHRAGHVVSHGNTGAERLQHVLNHLRRGHYRLHVAGRPGEVTIRIGG